MEQRVPEKLDTNESPTTRSAGSVSDPAAGDRPVPMGRVEARARFEALATEHLDGLYRFALRLTRNRTSAEDLVQTVMLKAWRSFETFRDGTNSRAWLHRIMLNAHIETHRKRAREPQVVDQEDADEFYLYDKARESAAMAEAGNPETQVLEQLMDAEVRESLEALPSQFRVAVLLADVQGFSYKEIAEILGIPVGTVMSRLFRGRHMLQRRLWEYARARHYVTGDRK
jgi:RNA polymerase sigma-70 factor (ECF subfamily)